MQIPVHLGYKFGRGDIASLFVQTGPTFGIGLTGSDIEVYGAGIDVKTKYFDVKGKRFDLSLGSKVGLDLNHFMVSDNVSYGVLQA